MVFRSRALVAMVCLFMLTCTTTKHYERRAETDRSSYLAAEKLAPGMSLADVVNVMVDSRLGGQYVSLSSGAECPDVSTKITLHSGELLATVAGTDVYAGGFASLEIYESADKRLSSFGFERQGPFREAVKARQQELLVCSQAELSFEATVEGGCGTETIVLTFEDGLLSAIGAVSGGDCAQ